MSIASTAAIAAPGYRARPRTGEAGRQTHAADNRIRTVHNTYGAMLHRQANPIVQDRRLGEDIVQETMTRCCQRSGLYDPVRGSM